MTQLKARYPLLLILLLGCLAYANSLPNEFAYDARTRILENPSVTQPTDLGKIFSEEYWQNTRTRTGGSYRPLAVLSLNLNYQLWGPKPLSFKLVDLALHLTNACLIFWLLMLLGSGRFMAVAGATLFVVHPVTSESLNHGVTRANLLASLFFLSSLYLFARLQIKKMRPEKQVLTAIICGLLYLASLFCKESTATALPIFLLISFFPADKTLDKNRLKTLFLQLSPLVAGFILYLFIRYMVVGPMSIVPSVHYFKEQSTLSRWPMVLRAMGQYFSLYFFPGVLSADYSRHSLSLPGSLFSFWPMLALTLLAGWSAAALALFRRSRFILFSLVFFLCTYFPVSNMLVKLGAVFSERFMYLPAVAFSILLAQGLAWLASWKKLPRAGLAAWILLGLMLVPLASRTLMRNRDWSDNLTLIQRTVETFPDSIHMRLALARLYFDREQPRLALPHLQHALQLDPQNQHAIIGLAKASAELKQPQLGIQLLTQVSQGAKQSILFFNLGVLYTAQGNDPEAIRNYWQALKLEPQLEVAWINLGNLYRRRGELKRCLSCFRKAAELNPERSDNWNNLGGLYMMLPGEERQARQALGRAIELSPRNAKPLRNMALLARREGNYELALRSAKRVYQLVPNADNLTLLCRITGEAGMQPPRACLAEKSENK